MKHYTVYDSSGRILRSGTCSDASFEAQMQDPDEHIVEGSASMDTHWAPAGVLTPKSANPATITGNIISNLPSGSVLVIENQRYPVNDGTATVNFNRAGTYEVLCTALGYLDKIFQVTQA